MQSMVNSILVFFNFLLAQVSLIIFATFLFVCSSTANTLYSEKMREITFRFVHTYDMAQHPHEGKNCPHLKGGF